MEHNTYSLRLKNTFVWILVGTVSLWLGVENTLLYVPGLIILYPISLSVLGKNTFSAVNALRFGWILGLFGSSLSFYWMIFPIHDVGDVPWLLTIPCVLFVGSYFGFFCGVFSCLSYAFRFLTIWRRAFLLGCSWYLLEWTRSWLFTGFPWLPLVIGFSPYPFMLQFASVIGVYALSGLYVGLLCLFFEGLFYFVNTQVKSFQMLYPCIVAITLSVMLCSFGIVRLNISSLETENGIMVGLVQGNDIQDTKWTEEKKYKSIERYIELSKELLKKNKELHVGSKRVELLVWPETVIPFDICSNIETIAQVKLFTFIHENNVPLLFGAPGIVYTDRGYDVFNRAYFYEPQNTMFNPNQASCLLEKIQWYEKEHLVPFGEYVPPFLQMSFFASLLQEVGAFNPGQSLQPIVMNRAFSNSFEQILMGTLICYEAIFPDLARRRVAEGAQILITISNDSWFGQTSAARQHLRLAQMRALELRRWMARATTSGISAFIDPYGRVVAETALFVPAFLEGTVIPLTENTIYFTIAPWLPCIILVVFTVLLWHSRGTFFIMIKKRDTYDSVY